MKNKVITLVEGKDGVFGVDKKSRNTDVKKYKKPRMIYANDFFEGMDAGLDFLEELDERLNRLFRIR